MIRVVKRVGNYLYLYLKHTHTHVCVYISLYVYIYIYIYRERERAWKRDRGRQTNRQTNKVIYDRRLKSINFCLKKISLRKSQHEGNKTVFFSKLHFVKVLISFDVLVQFWHNSFRLTQDQNVILDEERLYGAYPVNKKNLLYLKISIKNLLSQST